MMNPFRVWAPNAQSVDLVLESGDPHPMTAEDSGWWALTSEADATTRYRFRIDGGNPMPDPRSAWQPDGVHGPSAVVDHTTFPWHDGEWSPAPLSRAVIYEFHVGTFSPDGTYSSAAEKLPYLRDLGITHLEMMPIASFPGARGWGYDGVALFAPHPPYGSPDDLKRFIQAAHDHGIAVLLDVVYNHLGPDGNYLGQYGPYFTDRYHTPWGSAVNFDGPHSDTVREFFIDNALQWLRDYHFDGLRLDAVHAIIDERAVHFLEALAIRVEELGAVLGRHFDLIAESDRNDPRLVHSHGRGGYGLQAHWMDDFHHAVHAFFTGERNSYFAGFGSMEVLAKACQQGYVFDGQWCPSRQRSHGRPPLDVLPHQLVVFAQNHDQTGNRALGERLNHLVDPGSLRAIAALTLLSPFVPMLFQGEEWGASAPFLYFTDHEDQNLARLVTEGRRREFSEFHDHVQDVPDPQAPDTFTRSALDWAELTASPHSDLLAWHRSLIAVRAEIPPEAPAEIAFDEGQRWFTLRRGPVVAAFNFSAEPQPVPLPPGDWSPALVCPDGKTVISRAG